ncbi:MAG: hypothetical protein KME19_17330 [Microcoleus vaginatus WJT46-NPBG5]|nr:hypothetical protein [Microcoleus vaginatus WJT46-NPBG5]
MTNQLQMSNCPSPCTKSPVASDALVSSPLRNKPIESMKSPYQADQQVKFLHLQAEIETLLLQLQTIKQRQEPQQPVLAGFTAGETLRQPAGVGR